MCTTVTQLQTDWADEYVIHSSFPNGARAPFLRYVYITRYGKGRCQVNPGCCISDVEIGMELSMTAMTE